MFLFQVVSRDEQKRKRKLKDVRQSDTGKVKIRRKEQSDSEAEDMVEDLVLSD